MTAAVQKKTETKDATKKPDARVIIAKPTRQLFLGGEFTPDAIGLTAAELAEALVPKLVMVNGSPHVLSVVVRAKIPTGAPYIVLPDVKGRDARYAVRHLMRHDDIVPEAEGDPYRGLKVNLDGEIRLIGDPGSGCVIVLPKKEAGTVDVVPMPKKELEKLQKKAARFEELEDMEREVERERMNWLDLKERTAAAKKRFDALDEMLRKRIRDKQDLLYPPTDKAPAAKKDEKKPAGEKKPDAAAKPTPADDDAWKAVTLEALGIDKPNVVARLFDEGITNFGQLEEWRVSGKKIAGLGDAARQLIEDAVVAYWAKHPRQEKPKNAPIAAADKVDPAAATAHGDTSSPTIIEIRPKGDLDSGKVLDVLDLGLSEGVVAKAAHPDLAEAIKRGTPDVTTLFRDPKGHRFAAAFNPTAPAAAGLFLLFRVFEKSGGKPSPKDPYYGAPVTFGDMTLYLGPLLDAASVKDVAAKKAEAKS